MTRYTLVLLFFVIKVYTQVPALFVQSTAFANGNYIPYRYACDADNVNPCLKVEKIPAGTKSLALIMIDSSMAFGEFDHWLVWNIPPTGNISENSHSGVTGRNSRKENKYLGPCPPNGVHEYQFRIYALNVLLNISDTCGKQSLMKEMTGHVLSRGKVTGLFQRQ